jgi:hypothetical protein
MSARVRLSALAPTVQSWRRPGWLTVDIPSAGTPLRLSVTTDDDDLVAVPYADPRGGTRTVTHAALARVELSGTVRAIASSP